MATLKERLHGDVVAHLKEHNKVALGTVRSVLGEIETREKSGKRRLEVADAQVIEAYLPKALSAPEVETIVDEVIEGLRADGTELSVRHMGAVMKPVTARVAGRFDGKAVSDIVRQRLA